MNFSFKTAIKLIFSEKKKTLINFLSYTSIVTLSIGTAAMIVVLSVYNGLEETLKSIYNDFDPDIKIEKKEGLFFENNLIENINKISLVKEVSAIIENKVIVQNEEKEVVAELLPHSSFGEQVEEAERDGVRECPKLLVTVGVFLS